MLQEQLDGVTEEQEGLNQPEADVRVLIDLRKLVNELEVQFGLVPRLLIEWAN